jgi:AAA+ ATPase superfamily predicted ATPase
MFGAVMENPFSYSEFVTGEAFCNREKGRGKTSLVHEVIHRLKKMKPKVNSVYIDLYGTLDENDFIDATLTSITQIESKLERILKRVAGLKVTGSFDPVTGLPTLSASITPREKPQYLERALQILASYSGKQTLLVVFDEFQEIAKYSEEGFEKRLRKVIQGHHNISYIFSGSQKHILIQMFDSAKHAFYKMARSYPLQMIAMHHYIDWAKRLFKKKNLTLDAEIIANVVERCDYQPMYIQQFLFDLWRSDIIDSAKLEDIEKSVISSQKNQFIVLWNLLTQNQKKALRLVAETGGRGIYTAERLQQAGFNSGSVLQRALSALMEKEILSKNGTYQFQDAMLIPMQLPRRGVFRGCSHSFMFKLPYLLDPPVAPTA